MTSIHQRGLIYFVVLCVAWTGCKKKVVSQPPAPPQVEAAAQSPPSPRAPLINQFTAEPASIQRGQSAILQWRVTGEIARVSINRGIGTVQQTAQQQVSPNESTTYTLTADGPGGSSIATAVISVTSPPELPPEPPPAASAPIDFVQRLTTNVQDAYFDFNSTEIRPDAKQVLTQDAEALKGLLGEFPKVKILIEGHCDERGSAEYNLALGDLRAESARKWLMDFGISGERLQTISHGKEKPQCTDHNEECWQSNRRVHFVPGQALENPQ